MKKVNKIEYQSPRIEVFKVLTDIAPEQGFCSCLNPNDCGDNSNDM
jgi:hypothetical protein